ncbi:MAG: membrane-bound lytic murein transglycosylase MltF [Gammaproteobacteria bacterium]
MKSLFNKLQVLVLAFVVAAILVAVNKHYSSSLLHQIKSENKLTIITRNSPTTYYIGPNGPTGFEYELAQQFTTYLGAKLDIVVKNEFHQILPSVVNGDAHLGAAGITHTKQREAYVNFGPEYTKVSSQFTYKSGQKRPESIVDLYGKRIAVVKGSSHAQMLLDHKEFFPELEWKEYPDLTSEELMLLTSDSLIDYTIADSNELAITRRYFPNLRVGFNLGPEQPLAWALKKTDDNSLQKAVNKFFAVIETDGTLTHLREKYFGHVNDITPIDSHTFLKHVRERLPKYENLFKEAAIEHDQDWRFIAAVSYQESLWNSNAVSPTGVKGLMMLTRDTANDLNISDREDPHKSVNGGTKYFLAMHEKIPARIAEPDRTWMALASYNVGFGHLEDARILTQNAGDNPDLWMDVRKYLPLLSNKKWYEKTRHGYARGKEPVVYVQNIRNYFDLLVWLESKGELYEMIAQN